jgi:bla regulator protein blaR1
MMFALGKHLLDSTIFALLVGVLTLVFRRRGPETRYALWLLATAKFLLPVELISLVGSRLAGLLQASHVSHAAPVLFLRWVTPSALPLPAKAVSTGLLELLLVVWLVGCLVMLITWLPRLWRTPDLSESRDDPLQKFIQRLAQRVGLRQAVTLRFSDSIAGPLLFGFRKPIIMLPTGLSGKLSSRELQSVILHELAHAKRKDNWTAAFSHGVTCIFWFYPLLWWIEQRLHRERESACDEIVVRCGAAPGDYVAGILKVCRLQLSEGFAGVSGVCRSNLKNRMEAIMSFSAVSTVTPGPKRLLGSLVAAVFLVPMLAGFLAPTGAYGRKRLNFAKLFAGTG